MKTKLALFFLLCAFTLVAQEKRGTIKVVKEKQDDFGNILEMPEEITDTIKINNATFKIVIPKEYKSKLFPKIYRGRFVLVDDKGSLADISINSCVFSLINKGMVSEYFSYNSLLVPMMFAVSNNPKLVDSNVIISSVEGSSPGGVTLKNVINSFYLKRIR